MGIAPGRKRRKLLAKATSAAPERARLFQKVFGELSERSAAYVTMKWRLDEQGWSPGEFVPRPRTADELADKLGTSAEAARSLDAAVILQTEAICEADILALDEFVFLTVPIEQAQTWWEQNRSAG